MSKIKYILSVIHYTTCGAVCFQFTHSSCNAWENIYTLSYYHHQIGSMNYYPLFRVRSWNNETIGNIPWGPKCPGGSKIQTWYDLKSCFYVVVLRHDIAFRRKYGYATKLKLSIEALRFISLSISSMSLRDSIWRVIFKWPRMLSVQCVALCKPGKNNFQPDAWVRRLIECCLK